MPFTLRGDLPRGFVTRFAPAPTGFLHLGHVASALWVWEIAHEHGGRVLLRIEDHDRGRSRPAFEAALLDDLDWLGLVPANGGTATFRSGTTPFRQGDNLARYRAALESLERAGLAYPCDCTRSTITRAAGGETEGEVQYPGTCRERALDPRAVSARRLRIPSGVVRFDDLLLGPQEQDPQARCGDVLIRDRTGNFTYQFCNVVDDFDQGVTVVIRGADLLDSTARQIQIARILGRNDLPRYLHHPLITGPDGRKLSKSDGATGVRDLRAAGATREEVLASAARLGGLFA